MADTKGPANRIGKDYAKGTLRTTAAIVICFLPKTLELDRENLSRPNAVARLDTLNHRKPLSTFRETLQFLP